MLSILSTSVLANTLKEDRAQLDQEMATLQTPIAEQGFIQVDFDSTYEVVEYSGYVVDLYAETYITHHQAKKMGLEKTNKFFVYNNNDELDTVSEQIAKKIDVDQPDYFSVQLYKDFLGNTGEFRYVAQVIEYR